MRAELRGKYAIAGVGESGRWKKTPLSVTGMAVKAARAALDDAQMEAAEIDFALGYQEADSCSPAELATALGIERCGFFELFAGGTSSETLIGAAIGLLEAGLAKNVLIFRSMRGRSGKRMGGGGGWTMEAWENVLPRGPYVVRQGMFTAGQRAALLATRHLHEAGLSEEVLGAICVAFYEHAQRNDRAVMYGKPLSLEQYYASPYIATPLRLHDFCVETDEANALIVSPVKTARRQARPAVAVRGVVPTIATRPAFRYAADDPIRISAETLAPMLYESAGITAKDVDVAALYDCFSWVVLRQIEAFKFAARAELGDFVGTGQMKIGGAVPMNTAGGMLAEGYTHGMNNVLELVRQLRGEYGGTARQVEGAEIGLSTGWGGLGLSSGLVLNAA